MDQKADNGEIISYTDAVDFAYEALAELYELPDEAEKLAVLIVYFHDNDDSASLGSAIEAARSQALSFDALSRAAAILIRKGAALHPVLATWTAKRLGGEIERPPISANFKRGWPGATVERDLILHGLVVALQGFGITATRNDVSPATSGCDAVAAAMARRGKAPSSFKEIKAIYLRIKSKYEAGGHPGLGLAAIKHLIKDTTEK